MLKTLMAQLMARSAGMAAPQAAAPAPAPAAPSIPSASYPTPPPAPLRPEHNNHHGQHNQHHGHAQQQQQHHQPNPNNLMGLTGAALELAKGRYSTHASHADNMMVSQRMSTQNGHSGYQARQPTYRPQMGRPPVGRAPTGYKPSFGKKPMPKAAFGKRPVYGKRPIRTTLAPTTESTYADWDCGRDTAGILWCAGNRIFEKKEKPKPKAPKNTYGKTQISKFVKQIDFNKKPKPTKWVPPQPNLGIRNRNRSNVHPKKPYRG